MKNTLGMEYDAFIKAYSLPPVRGLRVNTLKISVADFCTISPWMLTPTNIIDDGFVVSNVNGVGRHPFHIAGLFYMQEPSAMSVIDAACITPGSNLKVLDLCAAPGGKTGGVAARMSGNGIILANEIVPQRAKLLARNIERLGITNASVICAHPETIAKELPCYFDRVLVDAPCSGEGMFRKDATAIAEWSVENVTACSLRQKAILESAAKCVAPNGLLIYSTCTFSYNENELVVGDFLNKNRNFSLDFTKRLYPHTCIGEGHFVARLRRNGNDFEYNKSPALLEYANKQASSVIDNYLSDVIDNVALCKSKRSVHVIGESALLTPLNMPSSILKLRPFAIGVEIGTLRKGRIVPSHTFYMAELAQKYRLQFSYSPTDPRLHSYLSGNTLDCDESFRGFCAVAVQDEMGRLHNIGFGKAVDGVIKNHIPKGLYVL